LYPLKTNTNQNTNTIAVQIAISITALLKINYRNACRSRETASQLIHKKSINKFNGDKRPQLFSSIRCN
jgi:hypothetical protein